MLKTNYRRRISISDGATAGSKLDMDMDIDIGGPAKTPGKPAATDTTPPNAPPVSLATPKPVTTAPTPVASPKTGSSPKPIDQTNLNSLKQQALTKLSPLVDDLEQPPLEHFRTLMMLIQATDDSSLIRRALETASSISDDKERAQALLDIVNEINYFTSQTNKNKSTPN